MTQLTPQYLNDAVTDKLAGLLGIEVVKSEKGRMQLVLEIGTKHLAINDFLHAGTIVTLADTAAGNGCLANLPPGATGFTTIELKTNLIRTLRSGRVVCDSQCIHTGKTTQVWESKVMEAATRKLLATFTCTQLILYPRERK